MSGEIIKTEWIIQAPEFGKRRIWKDDKGVFYVVHNMVYRDYRGEGDDCKVYKSDSVRLSRVDET